MANFSNIAYDQQAAAPGFGHAIPAQMNLKKLMQEEGLTQTHATAEAIAAEASPLSIDTRFGRVELSGSQPILFRRGILGMPDKRRFALVNFPDPRFAQFKLLQSYDDHALSFITLPLDVQPSLIRAEDVLRAAEDVGMATTQLAALLIVTVHRTTDKVTLSVNARAPLLVDAATRDAVQYVFPHDRYSVQLVLGGDGTKA